MLRVVVPLALLSPALAVRVATADTYDKHNCPESTSDSLCPKDNHYCRKTGGCYPSMEKKYENACGTPLCPLPKAGGNRHEAVVIDKCGSGVKCPGSMLECPLDKGCYPRGDKRCGVPLCGDKSGSGGKPSPSPRPSGGPRPSPRPTPRPRPSNVPKWNPPAPGGSILQAVDTKAPPADMFPPNDGHYMPPMRVARDSQELKTPQTNKFWTNWISGKPKSSQKPVYSMPYSLRFTDADDGWKCHYYESGQDNSWCKSRPTEGNHEYNFFGPDGTCGHCHCCKRVKKVRAELMISHKVSPKLKYNSKTSPRRGRIAYYISRFVASYSMGAKEESTKDHFTVDKQSLLGVRAVINMRSGGTLKFPVYRGMPYVSGKYNQATPRIDSPQGFVRSFKKIKTGVFEFTNDEGHPDKMWDCHYYEKGQNDAWCRAGHVDKDTEYGFFGDAKTSPCGQCDCCQRPKVTDKMKDYGQVYRAYVMDYNGNLVAGDFTNTSSGFTFNKKLTGWVRMAHIIDDKDAVAYEKHAGSILESVSLDVKSENEFHYNFKRSGKKSVEHLHLGWRHQKKLIQNRNEIPESQITHIMAPTKGKMVPLKGDKWILKINTDKAKGLDLLPAVDPTGAYKEEVKKELRKELSELEECVVSDSWSTRACEKPRTAIFTAGFYTNGKGLQKLGTQCIMAKKLFGSSDSGAIACRQLLAKAFRCHSDPNSGCGGIPRAYYDKKWGGIASRQGFNTKMCGLADFGNACYNDHHYHYGYFIHAAAQMLEVDPEMRKDNGFVAYINSMVRDIMNPSTDDKYFPQFRAFDWYDLHSWSHGVTPSADGKDEESTSEDVNAYFGIQQWAKRVQHKNLEKTARMVLSLLSFSAANLFLMVDGNDMHPPDFVKNHVTGIFFEAKAHYGTFFGSDECYIHGIQMIPLSPALRLARSKEFAKQEYKDILSKKGLPLAGKHSWSSLLITGNLAFHDAPSAWNKLKQLKELDRGLSRSWAMYWTASMAAEQR